MGKVKQKETIKTVIERAKENPDFRRELLKNPRGTMKNVGVDLPEKPEVVFLENTAEKVYFIIPPSSGDELEEEEFGQIAGGAEAGGSVETRDRALIELGMKTSGNPGALLSEKGIARAKKYGWWPEGH